MAILGKTPISGGFINIIKCFNCTFNRHKFIYMKLRFIITLAIFMASLLSREAFSQSKKRSFYEIKVYHFATDEQGNLIDAYLKNAFLPALSRLGTKNVGVFKPVEEKNPSDKRVYVLIPFKTAKEFTELSESLGKDQVYNKEGEAFLDAVYNRPPFTRVESIFIKAFEDSPQMQLPSLNNEAKKRIYELRSYEGPTEKSYLRKVHMFNQGGEISLFKRLGFNAVFYGSVLSGSRMPNLMYMTTFEDMPSRDEHWKAFFSSPEWTKLLTMDFYKNSVSKSDIILLHPTDYSGI